MPDDEPLDDARAVGMAAAAAAAKVVETAARAAADQRDREQRLLVPDQTPRRASAEADAARRESRLDQAEAWTRERDPKALDLYIRARLDTDTPDGRRAAESALIRTWERATQQPYDSPARRTDADNALKAAGVTHEPRKARVVSDLLNGADPATAAASGKVNKVAAAPAKQRTIERARTR